MYIYTAIYIYIYIYIYICKVDFKYIVAKRHGFYIPAVMRMLNSYCYYYYYYHKKSILLLLLSILSLKSPYGEWSIKYCIYCFVLYTIV